MCIRDSTHTLDTERHYTAMIFTVGQELQLIYSVGTSPSHFSCQLHDNAKLLETLRADISCTVSGMSTDHPASLSPSELVLAQCSADQQWCRAQVVTFDPAAADAADVIFVDRGNCDTVSLTNVRWLPKGFLTLPKQSITCSLSGVKPPAGEDTKWTQEAMEKLRELATECEYMTATVVGVSEANIIEVSLRSDSCQDFSNAMVESGHAVLS